MLVVKMLIQYMTIYFLFTRFKLFFMLQNSYWFYTLHCMRDNARIYQEVIKFNQTLLKHQEKKTYLA